ncbi:MAG: UDP-N-acetylmuramoyl-L-alanine--D-glutamate ligase [Candidatus Woesebacteria bacterium]|nr:UDP-N-acetylmuramoyl-L-alanine--D-glutamate ligase [Candidatus Woesebacteria bacterium]
MIKRIHMMGVGGSGMAGIAYLAKEMGYLVTGCDLEESTAYSDNFYNGHSPDHLKSVDLLVVTPAVYFQKIKDPELVEGEKRGMVVTWQEFLGKYLHKGKKVICVAGTHGKSTTTAMIGKLLTDAGLDPLVNLGANYKDWNGGARFGKGDYFVTEADEFFDNFLYYHPEIIILNNIEFDHPDYFKSEKQIFDSYKKFIGNLVGEKVLIANGDSQGIEKILKEIDASGIKIIKYSLKDKNIDLSLRVMGKHNVANALGVVALGKYLKIRENVIAKSLENFSGIGRRMELIADRNGIKVYDDYAHHPTAIAATLEGLRSTYPKARIWAIDEPHGFDRTKALLSKYKNVFKDADKVIIGPIFRARDAEDYKITPVLVAKRTGFKGAVGVYSLDEIKRIISKKLMPGDIVLVMGAGKSYLWAREIAGVNKTNIKIQENISLKELTTFKIGGPARYYAEVKNEEDVLIIGKFIKKNNLKIFILGGGSDILIDDKGFDGIVIKYVGNKLKIEKEEIITAEAGLSWDKLVEFSIENSLQGIECMSGIPGTVGASPVQNIGAYGQEIKDTLLSLRAFEFKSEKFLNFSNKDCQFNYRDGFFKKPGNFQKYLITSVSLKLFINGSPKVEYESLSNYLKEKNIIKPSLNEVREAVFNLRREKLENPKEFGNAGSFFKNPVVDKEIPGIPGYPFGNKYKLFAGWLIDKAGWKGKSYKGAAVSSKNAPFLINKSGKANSSDVIELAKKITKSVKEKFGVILEPEVQFIGFGKKVAILGYGLEGQDAEKYFKVLGDDVTILDRKFSEDYLNNLNKFDVIVRSPGVYRYLPEIIKAEKEGVEIASAIKIFFDKCPARIIGITGTKGKGTTSTLIYEILKNAGKDVYLVGNIGKPYLELLPKLKKDSLVVMELSSFQLIDLTRSPQIAVVLNITLDHMDWHKDKEEYIKAKENIVRHQTKNDYAVINSEYDVPRSFSKLTKGKVILFSKKDLESKYKEKLLLRGEHNLENIAAAVSVAKIIGVNENIILRAVQTFKGLEHRLELVDSVNGVTFYNDSFATGPQPTIAAIKSFTEPETLILGGSDKGLDYTELGKVINKKSNIKNIILIGSTAEKIRDSIGEKDLGFTVYDLGFTPMKEIVGKAFEITPKGGVVILSPASASFDMFENYKDRGMQFKKAVLQINEKET